MLRLLKKHKQSSSNLFILQGVQESLGYNLSQLLWALE